MAAAACNWDDALIVLSVTSGVTDLLLNFLFHAHRAGVDLAHVRVIAYDNASRSVADGCLGPGRTLAPASRVVLGDYIYGQQSFFKIQVNKLPAVRRLLATERRPIVFSDIDTVWLQNPARALLSRSNASFQIAPDGSGVHARDPTKRDMGCGCFFAAHHGTGIDASLLCSKFALTDPFSLFRSKSFCNRDRSANIDVSSLRYTAFPKAL